MELHLKAWRKIIKMSRQTWADESGVSYSMIRDLETGRKDNPSLETMKKLAYVIGIEYFMLTIDPRSNEIDYFLNYKSIAREHQELKEFKARIMGEVIQLTYEKQQLLERVRELGLEEKFWKLDVFRKYIRSNNTE